MIFPWQKLKIAMQNDNQKIIQEINELIEINNDRTEGYKKAIKEVDDSDLKDLFKNMSEHSFGFRNELSNEVIKLGGKPLTRTTNSGKLFRAWMDIRSALTSKDRKTVLNSCEFGEDAALDTYAKVLRENHLNPEVRGLIMNQKQTLQQDHDRIKSLRDMEKKK